MTAPLLADEPLGVINVGVEAFAQSVRDTGGMAVHVDWRPVGDGDPSLAWALAELVSDAEDSDAAGARIDRANAAAVSRITSAQPILVDVALHAREVWPDLGRTLLHAGAPVAFDAMCGPMQGAMIGALLYERWAEAPDAALKMLRAGAIRIAQCHDFGAVGPMAGIISPSMPLFVVKNATHDNVAYSNMSEGIGRVLRFGANGPDVIERLRWIETTLAPTLKAALAVTGGIDLKAIQAQALLMGDEVHSRNAAATLQFLAALAVALGVFDAEKVAARQGSGVVGRLRNAARAAFEILTGKRPMTQLSMRHALAGGVSLAVLTLAVMTAANIQTIEGFGFRDTREPIGVTAARA